MRKLKKSLRIYHVDGCRKEIAPADLAQAMRDIEEGMKYLPMVIPCSNN